jgi:hypothetical protein
MSNHKKKIFFVSLVLLLIIVSSIYFLSFKTRVKSFMGVDLGMSKNQVIYVLGYPESILNNEEEWKEIPNNELVSPESSLLQNSDEWSYSAGINRLYHYRIQPVFSSKTQSVISIYCYTGKNNDYISEETCPLYGLSLGKTEQYMYDKLGKPSDEEIDGLVKKVHYDDMGLEVHLAKKKIFLIKLSNF